VSRIAEKAAVAALDDAEGWVTRTIGEALANRAKLFDALERRGLRPIPSRANFLLFPVPDGSARAWNDALRAQGVAVRPFPACPDVGDAMRVTVAPWPMMERFLEALDAVLAAGEVAIPKGVSGK
jgi:histidinol-phosphate/aromatic aminotransferase/cobyric acid decarboxylase-like protein